MPKAIKQTYLKIRRQLLHWLAPVFKALRRRRGSQPVEATRLLFIRIDRIGDMTLSTPAFGALKKAFPRSCLTVLASPANAPLLYHNPHVDRVIIYRVGRNPLSKLRIARALKREAFDIVIDPLDSHDLEPALLAHLASPKLAIGFAGFGREVFFDRVGEANPYRLRFVDVAFDLLRTIGLEAGSLKPELFLTSSEEHFAEEWLSKRSRAGRFQVGIHPGAHYETQRWGVRNYSDLIRHAQSTDEVEWILIGGPADVGTVEAIRAESGGGFEVFIDGDLRRTMALISRLDALVCNNSGPLHIASALNIPTVSFMGPTVAERWWPVASNCRVLRAEHLNCLGCEKGRCTDKMNACMQSISPETAWGALMSLLSEVGRSSSYKQASACRSSIDSSCATAV
jgi:lipopolysaccharide heptosyltransferase II